MSVRLGLLAILTEGSCYGYQLRTELDRRTGSSGPINVGQVYNTLDRLERDKLAHKIASNYYEITTAGRAEALAWFASASPPGADLGELAAKIALATTLPGIDAAEVIRIQRASTVGALAAVTPMTPPRGSEEVARDAVRLALDLSIAAELRYLDGVELLLARAGELGIATMPLPTETPRRGRPPKAR